MKAQFTTQSSSQKGQIVDEAKLLKINDLMQILQPGAKYPFKFVGKLIADFSKKKRVSKDPKSKTPVTEEEFKSFGTGFLIGKNLVLTVGHVIYQRQFEEYAEKVTFYPETQQNQNSSERLGINAKSFQVFHQFKIFENEYSQIFDVGLIILEDNNLFDGQNFLNIKWSYKRWQMENKNFQLVGYPHNCINTMSPENFKQYIANNSSQQQKQLLYYLHTTFPGHSGAPLFATEKGNEPDEFSEIIGLHKGTMRNKNIGLTFNSFQNTQQMVLQLIESLGVEGRCKFYQPSFKKLKLLYEQELKVKQGLKQQIQRLKDCIVQVRLQTKFQSQKQLLQVEEKHKYQMQSLNIKHSVQINQANIKISSLQSEIKKANSDKIKLRQLHENNLKILNELMTAQNKQLFEAQTKNNKTLSELQRLKEQTKLKDTRFIEEKRNLLETINKLTEENSKIKGQSIYETIAELELRLKEFKNNQSQKESICKQLEIKNSQLDLEIEEGKKRQNQMDVKNRLMLEQIQALNTKLIQSDAGMSQIVLKKSKTQFEHDNMAKKVSNLLDQLQIQRITNKKLSEQLLCVESKFNHYTKKMEIKVNVLNYDQYYTLKEILDGGVLKYSKIAKAKIAFIKTLLDKVHKNIEIYLFDIFKKEDELDKHYNRNKNLEKYKWRSIDYWKKQLGVDLTEEGFFLIHWKKRVKMQEFIRDKDWNHLEYINFDDSEIDDAGWRLLVDHAHLFTNLKILSIPSNKISEIKEGDLDRFKSVQFIYFVQNPLTSESITAVKKFKEKNPRIKIWITINEVDQMLELPASEPSDNPKQEKPMFPLEQLPSQP